MSHEDSSSASALTIEGVPNRVNAHAELRRPERLSQRRRDLSAVRQRLEHPLGLGESSTE
jgi:hypothetical protein